MDLNWIAIHTIRQRELSTAQGCPGHSDREDFPLIY